MKKIFKHLLLILLSIIMIFPIVYVAIGSTNDSGWAFTFPFKFKIGTDFLVNFKNLLINYNLIKILLNSLVTSVITALLSLIIVFLMAYATSKYKFKGQNIIIGLLLSLMIIPESSYLIGQLLIINKFNLYSTVSGLIIPFVVNIRIFFYLKIICEYILDELLDAARIDGSNEIQLMTRISVPLIWDKLLLSYFLLFIVSWNNFLIPMIITNDGDLFTLPILISSLADDMRYDIGAVFMALFISLIPIIILYLIFQNRIFPKKEREVKTLIK